MADQESRDGLPPGYWEACRLAERGESDQARRLYAELEGSAAAAAPPGRTVAGSGP